MSTRLRTAFTLAALLALASPAVAQTDPFEAIVGDPDGASARLNDTALPMRNPTEDELRQYLEAFRLINLTATATLDDREGHDVDVRAPVGNVKVGPFSAPRGTSMRIEAGFVDRPNDGIDEAVLTTLELEPSSSMSVLGPLVKFDRMYLDGNGVIHFKSRLLGFDQDVTVEKIYRDGEGNLVFKTGGEGLASRFAPNMRIRPDGRVEYEGRGGFLWLQKKWKPAKVDGVEVKLDRTIPITNWPPRASDLIDFLPAEGAAGQPATNPIDDLRPVLEDIPISDLSVRFVAEADPTTIALSNDGGEVRLSNHELELNANGGFDGRTYRSDPERRNDFSATATIEGEVDENGTRARIDRTDVRLSGTHSATIPFEDPEKIELEATLNIDVDASLSKVRSHLPTGVYFAAPGTVTANFDADATLILRPMSGDVAARRELVIDRHENGYAFAVDGPIELRGLAGLEGMDGVTMPDRLRLEARDDPSTPDVDEGAQPIVRGEGQFGTKLGFIFTKTELHVDGVTSDRGIVGVIDGTAGGGDETEVRTTLKPGARARIYAYTFFGIKKSAVDALVERSLGADVPEESIEMGGVNATVDARISGAGEGTTLRTPELLADLPGETGLDLRVAARVRHGTRNGAETIVRSLAGSADVRLEEGEGEVEAGLPGGPTVSGRLAPGTRFSVETGRMIRTDRDGTELATVGLEDGAPTGKLEAHIVLTAGSMAHGDLAASFDGRTEVDLTGSIGFRLDPAPLFEGAPEPEIRGPLPIDAAVAIRFPGGARLSVRQPGNDADVTLGSDTEITLHTRALVDPETGAATLTGVDDLDVTISGEAVGLRTLLEPLGAEVVMETAGRTTVRIEDGRVAFDEAGNATRIVLPRGATVELAPTTIDLGGGGGDEAPAPAPSAPEPETTREPEPETVTRSPRPEPRPRRYTVVSGDSLSRIARRHGTSVPALRAANGMAPNENAIYPGEILTIPSE